MSDSRDQPLTAEESEIIREIRKLYGCRGEVRVIVSNAHIETYQVTVSRKPGGTLPMFK